MAIRLLESRFESLAVTDENEPVNGGPVYKSKVNIASHIIYGLIAMADMLAVFIINCDVDIRTWFFNSTKF